MEAYKVCKISPYGHEEEVSYFLFRETAQEDFNNRLNEIDSEVTVKPVLPHMAKRNVIMFATYEVEVSWQSDCGTEYDVDHWELAIEKIEIHEG
jgi:hypothetical protein